MTVGPVCNNLGLFLLKVGKVNHDDNPLSAEHFSFSNNTTVLYSIIFGTLLSLPVIITLLTKGLIDIGRWTNLAKFNKNMSLWKRFESKCSLGQKQMKNEILDSQGLINNVFKLGDHQKSTDRLFQNNSNVQNF